MSAHWHAHVRVPGGRIDRSPAMTFARATAFKDRCERRWSAIGRVTASRRGTLIVSGRSGTACVTLVPCADQRCAE